VVVVSLCTAYNMHYSTCQLLYLDARSVMMTMIEANQSQACD